MDKDLLTEMDNLLRECRNNGSISMTKSTDDLTRKAVSEAEARGWIYDKHRWTYKLTPLGIDVLDFGTVEGYLLNKKSKFESIPPVNTVINAQNIISGNTIGGDIHNTDNSSKESVTDNNSKLSRISNDLKKVIIAVISGLILIYLGRYL